MRYFGTVCIKTVIFLDQKGLKMGQIVTIFSIVINCISIN